MDPRRVLNNPTLWLAVAAAPLVYLLVRRFARLRSLLGFGLCAAISLLLSLLVAKLLPTLNFADGRYDGRSLIALSMAVLAGFYVRTELVAPEHRRGGPPVTSETVGWSLPFMGAAVGIVLASTALFLAEWGSAVRGMLRVVAPSPAVQSVQFITIAQASSLMSPDQARAVTRMKFYWVAPFRSFVLADGQTPRRVVIGDGDYNSFCKQASALRLGPGPYPPSAFKAWKAFTCNYVRPPVPDTMSKRLLRRLKRLVL